jgi:hypothetical protein
VTRPILQPPPNCCESLASIASRCGGAVKIHSAAEFIEYPASSAASEEVREFWSREARAEIAPRFIAHLPGGRVFGAGNVLSPDGRSLARDVSLDFGKSFEQHWLLTYEKIPPPRPIQGPTAVIATTLGTGYGHWLLDQLPRLLTLGRGQADTLIAHAAQPFSRVALAHWGWNGPIVEAERSTHVQCDQLIVPSLTGSVLQPTPYALELITDFTTKFHGSSSPFGERLCLTREGARRRIVTNEA